jgi:F-type H+-transporting ATPase subunit epsilon
VLILVEEAQEPGALDRGDLQDKQRKAEEALSRCEEGTEEHRKAARDKRRWETFIKIAEGS